SSITDPTSLSILSELMLIEYKLFDGFKPSRLNQTSAFLAKATHPLEVNHPAVNQTLSRYRKILNQPDGGYSDYLPDLTIHPYPANHMSIMKPPVLNQLANDLSHFLMDSSIE
ncbi:MAG TPA: hypothetical protein DCL40_04035, partial [Coxiellaceae bacterium]|nr:hypothetical protein [Coxiellaceae bacterium]